MRISMWMLANRLEALEPELHIRDDSPCVFRSARKAYSTNCVVVQQDGDDVVCEGSGDTIRFHDIGVNEAVEVCQDAFDYYDDWYSTMLEYAQDHKYEQIINESYPVFHNPLVLINGNCRVLAMSSQYGADEVDEEWNYLKKRGYSSVTAIHQFSSVWYRNLQLDGTQHFRQTESAGNSGISVQIAVHDISCGRLTLLEKTRKVNPGDYQLLELLGSILRLPLYEEEGKDADVLPNLNVFESMLSGGQVTPDLVRSQLAYNGWKEDDNYEVYAFSFQDPDPERNEQNEWLLANTLRGQFPNSEAIRLGGKILLICNLTQARQAPPADQIQQIAERNHLLAGVSLARESIYSLRALYDQAAAAIYYGDLLHPENRCFRFYDYAMEFIMESSSLSEAFLALHPDVAVLWKKKIDEKDQLFDTLKAYLNNERSQSKTSGKLYIHRNTLIYRLRKLEEYLHCDMDEVYNRDYMKLSIRMLELFERKYEHETGNPVENSEVIFPYLFHSTVVSPGEKG